MFYSAGGETERMIDESIDETEKQSRMFEEPISKRNEQRELLKKPMTNSSVDNRLLLKSEATEREVIMGSNTTDYHLGLAVKDDGAASEDFKQMKNNSALMFNESICDASKPQKIEDYNQSGFSLAGDVLREKLEFPDRQVVSDKMDFGVRATCSPKTKPSAKIKPYTVVDLSTMAALSPEEVDDCLKEVSESEKLKQECQDGEEGDPNENSSEAPDSIVLPPKTARNRSNTTNSAGLHEHQSSSLHLDQKMVVEVPQRLQIVSMSMEYSRPGQLYQQNEMSSFRGRAKTVPNVIGDFHREEVNDGMSDFQVLYTF